VLVVSTAHILRGQETPVVARLALDGWAAVRALAPIGAPLDRLGPVNDVLKQLDPLLKDPAAATIRAGLAAAQEERDEMAVYLAHARDLSAQISLTGEVARLPLPIDELEGELWLEVDHFAAARDAFQRATRVSGGRRGWIGLGRALDRLRDTAGACDAYRTARSTVLSASDAQEAEAYVRQC